MIRPDLRRCVTALAVVVAPSCTSLPHRPEIAECVAEIDRARLRDHVQALHEIGPRSIGDEAATRATVDYLADQLRRFGLDVHEETFEFVLTSDFVAVVRPVGEPDAEPSELELPAELASCGPVAMQAQTAQLVAEGWKVESYRLIAADTKRVCIVPNLIATRRGVRDPGRVIELSAHYDTVPSSPGGADNSSGVAALLEVARVTAGAPTRKTLRFCFFGGEEVGLLGSEVHVKVIRDDSENQVVGLLNLDSVGFTARGPGSQKEPEDMPWFLSFPDEGDFVVVVGEGSSGWLGNLFEGAIDTYVPELPYYSANRIGASFRDAFRSDHVHYWELDLPAIWLTDTGEYRSPHYHSAGDTPESVDFAFLESITRATAAAALHWAELEAAAP